MNQLRSLGLAGNADIYKVAGTAPNINAANFYDITSGSNGGDQDDQAVTGYDLVTGLGSPVASGLVPALVALIPPEAPTAISPQGNGVSATPAFTFTTVAGATGYQLWLTDGATWLSSTTWYTPAQVDPGNTGYLLASPYRRPWLPAIITGLSGHRMGLGSDLSVPGWCSALADRRRRRH